MAGTAAFVGYIVEPFIVDALMARGWRLVHDEPTKIQWRRQNDEGTWIIDGGQFLADLLEIKKKRSV